MPETYAHKHRYAGRPWLIVGEGEALDDLNESGAWLAADRVSEVRQ